MCESRDGKFVVPIKPSAGMGWWIGWVISSHRNFLRINLLWVENPERMSGVNIGSTPDYVKEFPDISEAMKFIGSKGAKGLALAPMEIGY